MKEQVTNRLTVFTKPWPKLTIQELGKFVHDLGFGGIELPVRPGYPVTPENVGTELPTAAKILGDQGVRISSIAGPTDTVTIEACGKAGVPIIRVCPCVDMDIGYMATEDKIRKEYDELVPALDKNNVAIGVQNHCDRCIGSAIGIMHLIEKYDPKHVGAVLDVAHCGFDGEPVDMAIDIVWSHLLLVNLKSGYWKREDGPEVKDAKWTTYWTTGGQGIASWKETVEVLNSRGYQGDICLTAEYSQHDIVDDLIVQDIAYARSLLA